MLPKFVSPLVAAIILTSLISAGCGGVVFADDKYFGKTVAPTDNFLRYISGSEPESLDPQLPDGQPEARIFMALYEGLVEYGPKDMQPIPALAKSWEISPSVDEFIFHLRENAKWSDGSPITADDFVYSLRRGFDPKTISRTAGNGYAIKYAEDFNGAKVFVKKGDHFITKAEAAGVEPKPTSIFGPETEAAKILHAPTRLTLPGDEKKRAKALDGDPKLKALVDGAELVPVKAEDIGVEALDKYTLRLTLKQSTPYFLGVLAHQFFRVVPKQAIEKYGKEWTRPANIVTSGPFKVKEYRPYDSLVVERDPNYWDAANVHLDGIRFFPVEDLSTMMNLYKAGSVDAFLNHSVPTAWVSEIRRYKDEYMNFPESATAYYSMNITKPPFNDIRIRRAFKLGLDNEALAEFRKITKPLYGFVPTGIFPDYDKAKEKVSEESRVKAGISAEEWAKRRSFDPEKARQLLAEAGFPVQKNGDTYSCPSFPTANVRITFNSNENNRLIGEYIQSQWKQNLGITIQIQTMEFKTFLPYFKGLQYEGFSQFLWSGDYMDPYTFLSLEYGEDNEGGSGFHDPAYDKLLDSANAELDPQKRFEMLAKAEQLLMDQIPVVPLTINATNWMKKPYVKGLYPNPGTLLPWKFAYIEKDPAKWDHDVENIIKESDPQVEAQLKKLKSGIQ